MSGLNWPKNFSHCSISGSVAPSSMQKLWTPLATIFVEKKAWKKFWCGSRPIWVTPWKEFLISWKKWRFEIFQMSAESRASGPWIDVEITNGGFWIWFADKHLWILQSKHMQCTVDPWISDKFGQGKKFHYIEECH